MKKILFTLFLIFGINIFASAKNEIIYPKPVVVSFYSDNCEECKQLSVTKEGSKVEAYIVPTDEEMMIARDTKRIVEGL